MKKNTEKQRLKNGYEITYNQIVHKLPDCDLNEAAPGSDFPRLKLGS